MKRYQRSLVPGDTPLPGIQSRSIERLTGEGRHTLEAGVVIEEPLEIRIDGRTVATLMRTPGLEKELAAGFCLGEGLVRDLRDVALIRHCGRALPTELTEGDPLDESRNRVDVTLVPGAAGPRAEPTAAPLIRSGCGRADVADLAAGLSPLASTRHVEVEALRHLLGQMTRQQTAYRAAGGVHAAAVFDRRGRMLVLAEDVGRHNAVDKATGFCLLRGIDLNDKLLLSTGRASFDMVAKGVRLGLPILASLSSPTSSAIELAEALNCTLLGYLRGRALNIYTHSWRVAGDHFDVEVA